MHWLNWNQLSDLNPQEFVCGFCGKQVGTNHGYYNSESPHAYIYICTFCGSPTYFAKDYNQYPGPLLGRNIEKLPSDIAEIYREVRESIKDSNFTAAQLLGRKLIMHLAVSVAGAEEGESFVQYIEHLQVAGYVPPNGKAWIDYVKKLGNEKNHEIKIGTAEESARILKFIEVLLIFIYEFAQDEGSEKDGTK